MMYDVVSRSWKDKGHTSTEVNGERSKLADT